MARIGARLIGAVEDGFEIDDDADELHWEAVTVNLDDYRWMGDPSFQKHFRISKPTYEALLRELAFFLIDTGVVQRIRNEVAIPLLMTLWILANPDKFRSVALRFGCMPGDVHFHYQYIIRAFRNMAPQYIRWPDTQERIVGAIDGTYQAVTAPVVHAERYVNRHHQHAFNSMVVADDNLLIRSVCIGEVGAMHDDRVFRRSPLCRQLLQNNNEEFVSEGQHLIGDSAYRIMDFLMVPFRNVGNLTPQQVEFNRRLSRCRMRIEHTFGKAFGQWRRMKMLHSYNIDIAIDYFTASYMLHNFMILNGEEIMNLDDPDPPFMGQEPAANEGDFDNQDDIQGLQRQYNWRQMLT
ncbi:Putative nuclease [Frankliniella fusca]|uniref:Nuclease n=1 Tax=Frankliniella fusca TaxID=407009 RepID=A0AAE1H6S5_9NEOP|nr:Putative nuclease [Frankliniella fusca]